MHHQRCIIFHPFLTPSTHTTILNTPLKSASSLPPQNNLHTHTQLSSWHPRGDVRVRDGGAAGAVGVCGGVGVSREGRRARRRPLREAHTAERCGLGRGGGGWWWIGDEITIDWWWIGDGLMNGWWWNDNELVNGWGWIGDEVIWWWLSFFIFISVSVFIFAFTLIAIIERSSISEATAFYTKLLDKIETEIQKVNFSEKRVKVTHHKTEKKQSIKRERSKSSVKIFKEPVENVFLISFLFLFFSFLSFSSSSSLFLSLFTHQSNFCFYYGFSSTLFQSKIMSFIYLESL